MKHIKRSLLAVAILALLMTISVLGVRYNASKTAQTTPPLINPQDTIDEPDTGFMADIIGDGEDAVQTKQEAQLETETMVLSAVNSIHGVYNELLDGYEYYPGGESGYIDGHIVHFLASMPLSYATEGQAALSFDLRGQQAVSKAVLRVYISDVAGNVRINLIQADDLKWQEPQFPFYNSSAVILPYENYAVDAPGWLEFTVTTAVNAGIAREQVTFVLTITPDTGENALCFDSRLDERYPPELILEKAVIYE